MGGRADEIRELADVFDTMLDRVEDRGQVPLLVALKQDPVRLLIADDVGIGKTVEALLVARELTRSLTLAPMRS